MNETEVWSMNFIGEKCVLCGKVFEESDNVVVCPECGSPHHKECYKKHNRCANLYMHETNQKWKRAEIEKPVETPVIVITPEEFEKQNSDVESDMMQDIGFNLNEDMGGVTLKEIMTFVGINQFYYIPVFKRMKDFGSKISFNLSCFLFPSLYFANRKMWFWAIIATVLSVILNIPASIMLMAESGAFTENILNVIYENQNLIQNMEIICSAGLFVSRILMCIFANYIYFKFSVKKIHIIKKNSNGELNRHMVMAFGGVKPINIILITLITMLMTLVLMVGITMFLTAV